MQQVVLDLDDIAVDLVAFVANDVSDFVDVLLAALLEDVERVLLTLVFVEACSFFVLLVFFAQVSHAQVRGVDCYFEA